MVNQIAEKLVEYGHLVTVLTGLPNYPSGVIYENYKKRKNRFEVINGVEVIRCPIIPRGKNYIMLALNYISFAINGRIKILNLNRNFDVLYVYQMTPISIALPALAYKKKYGSKVFCYCLDLAPASGSQILRHIPLLYKLYYKISNKVYNNCDVVGVTSRSFINYLNKIHGLSFDKMIYLPQHASEQLVSIDLSKKDNGTVDFMFAGNIGVGAKLETIILATKELVDKGYLFKVHFVGNGRAKTKLIELTDELKLNETIVFHDSVPMSEMPMKYCLADALLVTLRKGQITVPGKLQAYMSTNKPIFGAMDGSGKEMIHESNCGGCVDAEDYKGLASLMESFIKNRDQYTDSGSDGKKFFLEHFTIDKHVKRLEEVLINLSMKNDL